jgi:hypothetical protein
MGHRSHIPRSIYAEGQTPAARKPSPACIGLREELLFATATRADADIVSLQRLMDQLQRCASAIVVEAGCEIELDLLGEMVAASWPNRTRH